MRKAKRLSGVAQFDLIVAKGPEMQNAGGYLHPVIRERVECLNGTTVSIQASEYHYCNPRNNAGPYETVELGFPTVPPTAAIIACAENPDDPTESVYGQVPVDLVREWLAEEDAKAVTE